MVKNLIIIFLTAAFLALSIPVTKTPLTFANAPRLRIKSTLQPFVTLQLVSGQCSGSVVQLRPNTKPVVLTAAHCMRKNPLAMVEFFDGSVRPFKLVKMGKGAASPEDWAILGGDTQNILPLQVADTDVELPMVTFYVGRQQWIIPAVNATMTEGGDFVLLANVQPGDSGGALLSEEGKIIGIVHSYQPGTPFGFAAPIFNVKYQSDSLKDQHDSTSKLPQSEIETPQAH